MGSTVTLTGFIYVVIFLGLLVVATVAGCIAFFVVEWRKVRYIRPICGPTRPPYPGAFGGVKTPTTSNQVEVSEIV